MLRLGKVLSWKNKSLVGFSNEEVLTLRDMLTAVVQLHVMVSCNVRYALHETVKCNCTTAVKILTDILDFHGFVSCEHLVVFWYKRM